MTRWLLICVIAGCAPSSSSSPPQGDGHDQIVGPVEGQENQGRHLLGELIDDHGPDATYLPSTTTHARTDDGRAVEIRFTGGGALAVGDHVGMDSELDGLILDETGGGELLLRPSRGGTDLTFYTVQHRDDSQHDWVDVCPGGDVVPLAGRWSRTGLHEADADHISFACTGAVAWKCSVWGYVAGGDPESERWRAHQACTRMARADYCANGVSHTREGTTITIYDRLGVGLPVPATFPGIQHWPPDPRRFFFEAAWTGGDRPATCLGRLRWQSLPLGGVCAQGIQLPDPRQGTSARFCDDIDFATVADPPILFNSSHYADLELDVWVLGDDHVSTVRGYLDDTGVSPDRAPFPPQGYTHVDRDAMLLRAPIDETDPDLIAIHMYSNGTDKTLAAVDTPLPAAYTDLGPEGYSHRTQRGLMIAFDLFRDPTTGDVIGTTKTPPAPYERKASLGFLLPAD